MDTTFEYLSELKQYFGRVVADKGHKIKNPQSINSFITQELGATYNWILTATPWLNRVTDFAGYLNLLFRDEMRLDDDDKPPQRLDHYLDGRVTPKVTKSYKKGGPYEWKKHQMPFWRLDPFLYNSLVNKPDTPNIAAANAHDVLRGLIPILMLRRTQVSFQIIICKWIGLMTGLILVQATEMRVQGEMIRIGSSIPIYQICTVELDFRNEQAYQDYFREFRRTIPGLYGGQEGETPRKVPAVDVS